MGVIARSWNRMDGAISTLGTPKQQLDLLELGIQEVNAGTTQGHLRDYYAKQFASYISLDLHRGPGVMEFDLAVYDPSAFSVDVITNIGTTEHVEYQQGQYNCWSNIHSWLRVGGIAIHEIPAVASWTNHCRYYADYPFFQWFETFGYKIVELDVHGWEGQGNLMWAVLQKQESLPFPTMEQFYQRMQFKQDNSIAGEAANNNPKSLG